MRKKWCVLPLLLLTGCQKQVQPDIRLPEEAEAVQPPTEAAQEKQSPAKAGTPVQETDETGPADATSEQLGFAGANVGQSGLMAGDGEWVYYRSERDHGHGVGIRRNA